MDQVVNVMMIGIISVLIVNILLHRLFRFTRLQASAISGLMSIAVLVPYLILHWPGGDKAALYFSCNILTAYAYYLVGKRKGALSSQDGKRTHWAPITVFAFFVVLTIVDGAFVVMAEKGLRFVTADGRHVNTRFPGEVPNAYQKKEAYYNAYRAKMDEQLQRGWQVNFNFEDPLQQDQDNMFRIRVLDKNGNPINEAKAVVVFKRLSDQALNKEMELTNIGRGIYEGAISFSAKGRWDFDLNILKGIHEEFETNNNIIEVL